MLSDRCPVLSLCQSCLLRWCILAKTVGRITMKLGVHVPGHILLDGDPAPLPKKGTEPPIFGPCLLWPNGCMDEDATCYDGIGLGPGNIVLDADPASPFQKGSTAPNFRPMFVVAKRLDGSRCHLVRR